MLRRIVLDAITFSHVRYTYPNATQPVINDLSLSFEKGIWTAIIGHNGSGKSTIARLIDGLTLPQKGEIKVNGLPVIEKNLSKIHQQVGIVFQNPDNQFVGATVADDVAFGLENRQLVFQEMQPRIEQVLAEVGMQEYADYEPSRLSGGQKQRVAIAGVLALKPRILILDEATSMLDPTGRQLILQLLTRLRKQERFTIISITHDPNEMELADRMILLDHGQVIKQGETKDVLKDSSLLRHHGVGVPVSQQLKDLLIQRGVTIPERYMTREEIVEWLHQRLA